MGSPPAWSHPVNDILKELYKSTGEDFLYGVGALQLPDGALAPCVHLHYANWSREQLDTVRDCFADGLLATAHTRPSGDMRMTIATRQQVTLQASQPSHTNVLRAPGWDARLEDLDVNAFRHFTAQRHRYGGFLLLVQTPDWEFLAAVKDAGLPGEVGPIQARSFPLRPST
jgi:hypothetical protein